MREKKLENEDRYREKEMEKGMEILELMESVDGGMKKEEIEKNIERRKKEF